MCLVADGFLGKGEGEGIIINLDVWRWWNQWWQQECRSTVPKAGQTMRGAQVRDENWRSSVLNGGVEHALQIGTHYHLGVFWQRHI